jgi:hypothetical protein
MYTYLRGKRNMPEFLDAHPLRGLDEETLRNFQDEFELTS